MKTSLLLFLGCFAGFMSGITVVRPSETVFVPPPIHVEMRTCPKVTPAQYRQELVESALQVGWRCGPMGLGLKEGGR
jgi:hypothetical protein